MSKTVLALLSPLESAGCLISVVGVFCSVAAKSLVFPSKRFWVSLAHSVEGVPRGRFGEILVVVDMVWKGGMKVRGNDEFESWVLGGWSLFEWFGCQ